MTVYSKLKAYSRPWEAVGEKVKEQLRAQSSDCMGMMKRWSTWRLSVLMGSELKNTQVLTIMFSLKYPENKSIKVPSILNFIKIVNYINYSGCFDSKLCSWKYLNLFLLIHIKFLIIIQSHVVRQQPRKADNRWTVTTTVKFWHQWKDWLFDWFARWLSCNDDSCFVPIVCHHIVFSCWCTVSA